MKTQNEINFDGVIVTPLRRWKDVTLRLDDDVLAFLRELAARANQPFDNVLNHIMTDFLSEHLDLEKLSAKTLKAIAAKSSHIILMEGTKPFARVEIISPKDEPPVCANKSAPIPKDNSSAKFKAPDFRYECECASAAIKRNSVKHKPFALAKNRIS
ncbi:MAG: hypothetical protein J6V90_11165 [Treponema sp.]|nr:hypothetical protein [Treponema sp.]